MRKLWKNINGKEQHSSNENPGNVGNVQNYDAIRKEDADILWKCFEFSAPQKGLMCEQSYGSCI